MPDANATIWTTILWFILIPAAVSIGATLVANAAYPPLVRTLEGRRIISREKRRAAEERWHKIIEGLHDGTMEKVEYFVGWYSILVICFTSAAGSVASAGVLLGVLFLNIRLVHADQSLRPLFAAALGCGALTIAMGLFFLVLGFHVLRRVGFVRSALNNYDAYLHDRKSEPSGR